MINAVSDSARGSKIIEARALLRELGFDAERSNERSALVLLALLHLAPEAEWREAEAPMLRTVEIMDWIRTRYGQNYKPNTRETIRRQTLHQFVAVMLVEQNPDDPLRPVNSPHWCYQITPNSLILIRKWTSKGFAQQLPGYLADRPGLVERYAATRKLNRVAITAPDGSTLALSPGGQNNLIKQIIEDFAVYFLGGGQLLYIGDADAKWAVFEETALADLGVTVNRHGPMPDIIIYLPDRNWLVLIEAASSHGPVDAKRRAELATMFSMSTAGLVYVSCFPSRARMREYLSVIAWETEVWCADDPTHLIHFNGNRFLGPYD
jgi:hypothetical protein